ncbi:hypothetical protein GGX14DRAFT_596953 [Mycena pura]|uniref:Mid2 domain-containing protein n=1 Tax=Mycena pura TaxID=153505 RepID=A0AAD6XXQ4_9AGAR|nr:hypothetical protein GGX14DRAFT_596953 [Mycena pura]
MMLPRFTVLSLAYFLTHISTCFAAVSNRTIDDTYGDAITGFIPIYTSANWNVGQNCSRCNVRPDPHQAFDSSWHDITYNVGDEPPSVALEFTGTAIYLFSVVPNTVPESSINVSLLFILDGVPVGSYLENLVNEPHTLVAEPNAPSIFLLDRAIYTFEDASAESAAQSSSFAGTNTHSTQTSQTPVPATTSDSLQRHGVSTPIIVGIAVGAAAGAILVLFTAIMLCVRRRRRPAPPDNVQAYIVPYRVDASPPSYMPTDPYPKTNAFTDRDTAPSTRPT